jgi:hypothetical protein
MKHSNFAAVLSNTTKKLLFCSQLIIVTMALPSLYYVGVTHNTPKKKDAQNKHMIMTNKGKKLFFEKETTLIIMVSSDKI